MRPNIRLGLDRLLSDQKIQNCLEGNVAYLCHNASVTGDLIPGVIALQKLLGPRLIKLFGPQHGFVCDVQDNMVESPDYIHPYFKIPVHSLYSHTRIPTDAMLERVNTIVVDLQDVGTRVYTYISTLGLLMEKCGQKGIKVVVLDRPNPVGGEQIEGNVLEEKFRSFVGHHPIPMRHGMTMGEVAHFTKQICGVKCDFEVVKMEGWQRSMYFRDTQLTWVNPSPNLSTPESAITFPGTVLFEGTNVSEGRGTTRALEVAGVPGLEPYQAYDNFQAQLKNTTLTGFLLRPTIFQPTFQKHTGIACGGFHIHPTKFEAFNSWALGQMLCQFFFHNWSGFEWNRKPYEYEYDRLAIDLINGSEGIRHWVEERGSWQQLQDLEQVGRKQFLQQRAQCLLY